MRIGRTARDLPAPERIPTPPGFDSPALYDGPVADALRLIETIRAAVIGDDEAVMGPYGLRRVTYADYTASGRSLTNISPGGPG